MKKIVFMMMMLFGLFAAPLSASACHYSSDFRFDPGSNSLMIWIYDTNTFETVGYVYITNARGGHGTNTVTYNGKTYSNGARHQQMNVFINICKEIELDDDCMRQALTQQTKLYGIDIIKKSDDLRIDGCFDRFDSFDEAEFMRR